MNNVPTTNIQIGSHNDKRLMFHIISQHTLPTHSPNTLSLFSFPLYSHLRTFESHPDPTPRRSCTWIPITEHWTSPTKLVLSPRLDEPPSSAPLGSVTAPESSPSALSPPSSLPPSSPPLSSPVEKRGEERRGERKATPG